MRRVYTNHGCGLSQRFSLEEQWVAELAMVEKSSPYTGEVIPATFRVPIEETPDVVMDGNTTNQEIQLVSPATASTSRTLSDDMMDIVRRRCRY